MYVPYALRPLTSQYFDEETGLHYNYHRYYDPKTGRYHKPDPIGLAGGINLYTYAANNPINSIDPFGLFDWKNYSKSLSATGGVPAGIDPVPIEWGDYANALGDVAKSAFSFASDVCGEIKEQFTPEPYEERCKLLSDHVQCYIDYSGLPNIEGTAKETALILVVSEGALWSYAAYPVVMSAAGTPEGQRLLYEIADSISPNPPTTPLGAASRIIQELNR